MSNLLELVQDKANKAEALKNELSNMGDIKPMALIGMLAGGGANMPLAKKSLDLVAASDKLVCHLVEEVQDLRLQLNRMEGSQHG
ncbi:hypothetical protein AAOGI_06870 [Agarivorans albus]